MRITLNWWLTPPHNKHLSPHTYNTLPSSPHADSPPSPPLRKHAFSPPWPHWQPRWVGIYKRSEARPQPAASPGGVGVRNTCDGPATPRPSSRRTGSRSEATHKWFSPSIWASSYHWSTLTALPVWFGVPEDGQMEWEQTLDKHAADFQAEVWTSENKTPRKKTENNLHDEDIYYYVRNRHTKK